MADYVTLDDIKDEILVCTQDDLQAANGYIKQIATKLGVKSEQIVTPTPFVITRLGICYACYNRALMQTGTDATTSFDGEKSQDIYAQKRKLYLEEITTITDMLTASDFTGVQKNEVGQVSLSRA